MVNCAGLLESLGFGAVGGGASALTARLANIEPATTISPMASGPRPSANAPAASARTASWAIIPSALRSAGIARMTSVSPAAQIVDARSSSRMTRLLSSTRTIGKSAKPISATIASTMRPEATSCVSGASIIGCRATMTLTIAGATSRTTSGVMTRSLGRFGLQKPHSNHMRAP